MGVSLENNKNMLMLSQSKPHVNEGLDSKGAYASELHKHPFSKGIRNTSKLKKVGLCKNISDAPSGIPSCKGDKELKFKKCSIWNQLV